MSKYKVNITGLDVKEIEAETPEQAQRIYLDSIGAEKTDRTMVCIEIDAPKAEAEAEAEAETEAESESEPKPNITSRTPSQIIAGK